MRFMAMMKATPDSEAGKPPTPEDIAAALAFHEEMVKAGILLAADGLKPSSTGVRLRFSGNERTVIDGPFAETKELVAGFWMWQVKSMDEAVEWVKRCPNPHPTECEIELRRVFEPEDFGPALTPELREQGDRLRAKVEGQKRS